MESGRFSKPDAIPPRFKDYFFSDGKFIGQGDRYKVLKLLGKGSFGRVVSALDQKDGVKVAIKVIRDEESFTEKALEEAKVVKHLNAAQAKNGGFPGIVKLLEEPFVHHEPSGANHLCLVFEILQKPLSELARETRYSGGVSLSTLRIIARQLMTTLSFFSRPDVDVIHCDLKPDNIMFGPSASDPSETGVTIIDFGLASHTKRTPAEYVQTRHYRAPEVILGFPYTRAIDMWSVACLLFEVAAHRSLFPGMTEHDMMDRFVALVGPPSVALIEAAKRGHKFFRPRVPVPEEECVVDDVDTGFLMGSMTPPTVPVPRDEPPPVKTTDGSGAGGGGDGAGAGGGDAAEGEDGASSPVDYEFVRYPYNRMSVLTNMSLEMKVNIGALGMLGGHGIRRTVEEWAPFLDLLERMLVWDPEKRITPEEALRHPFLADSAATD